MSEKRSSCKIERTGVVLRLEAEAAVLRIEGADVMVPVWKVSPNVRIADVVGWNGTCWDRRK